MRACSEFKLLFTNPDTFLCFFFFLLLSFLLLYDYHGHGNLENWSTWGAFLGRTFFFLLYVNLINELIL